jgi:hypothetical protein
MGEKEKAKAAVEKLISKQSEDGSFPQAKTSITRSSGKSLLVETTSLALLSMLRVDYSEWATPIKKAVDYLMGAMNGGYFGSTQATILAMKALVEFMKISNQSSDEMLFDVIVGKNPYLMTVGDQMKNPEKGKLCQI